MSHRQPLESLESLVPPPPATGSTFPLLDSFRAVGALAVVTTHVAFWASAYTGNGVWGTLLARLDVGVAIFFVLSGFLLSRPHFIRAASNSKPPAVGRYLWKRALRILPVYCVTVAVALTFIKANEDLSAGTRAVTALMLNTFVDTSAPHGLTHMWSLAVEVTFYLLLPLIMLVAVGRGRTLRTWRVLAVLASMVALTVWWHLDGAARVGAHVEGQPQQWLPAFADWFALGIGLALVKVLHEHGRMRWLTAPVAFLGRRPGSCWALIGGLMLISATPVAGPTLFVAPTNAQSLTKNLLYAGVGTLVVVTGIFVTRATPYSRVFGHPLARRLGWISYGIFALHLAVLHLVMHVTGWELFEGHGWQIWVLTVVGSIVVAEVVYRVVERPALRLKNARLRWPVRPGPGSRSSAEISTPVSETRTR